MKILVTGGAGFIGSHLKVELERQGHIVIICDPRQPSAIGGFDNIEYVNLEGMDIDIVFHLGAMSGSLYFKADPIKGINTNCAGTANLLEQCKQTGVKKVIFASTGSSYGGTLLPHKEENILNIPNFYTATKVFDEMIMQLYHDLYGLETIIFRYASVYGDGEESKGNLANIISQFIWKMIKGERPDVWYQGNQTRDFIFVDDIVSVNIFAIQNLSHGIYNVGTGIETSFLDIVKLINKVLGTDIQPIFIEGKLGNVQKYYVDKQLFDVSRLLKAGWTSSITVEEGIKRIVDKNI